MKVLRSTCVAAVAIFAAACGDKVTVAGPVSTVVAAAVTAVAVAPATATMSVGQTISFTAAVTAVGGAAATVTWSSSDAAKVSVSATGVATAVAATPGVAVCASSTVNVNAKGCASVVVSAAATTIPATVSIQTITLNAGGLNAPVNPAAVTGAIDVRANVAPGTETVDRVVVIVGSVRADSQTFTAAQAAAIRYAADQAIVEQSAFPPILFTINTAKFNATTGVPAWLNGNQTVSIALYVKGNTAARSTATYQTPMTLVNADTYIATIATSGTVANALDGSGFRYDRGSITATALPVIYTGRTISVATLLFGSAACDANATGQRSTAMTLSGSTWTGTLGVTTSSTVGIASTVKNYEFTNNGVCTLNAVGETIGMTAVDANGDALFAAAAPVNANALSSLRLDNRAPQVGLVALVANPNLRNNGWVNASIALAARNTGTSTSNGIASRPAATVCAGGTSARDCGQGSWLVFARVAAATGTLVDDALAATASNAPTLPAPSVAPTAYCVVVTARDGLGNESALPDAGTVCTAAPAGSSAAVAANHMRFGVDIAAPTVALIDSVAGASTTGLNANMRRNTAATIGNGTLQNFVVTVADTGIIGNSGMNSANSVRGTVTLRNDATATALTAAQKCIVGRISATDLVTCTSVSVNAAPAFPLVAVAPAANNSGDGTLLDDGLTAGTASATTSPGALAITSQAVPGYYTYTGVARDAAGNTTAAVTRVIAYNLTANVPALTTALFNVPLTGSTAVFNANSSTNLDLWKSTYTMTYAGAGLAGPILSPSATLNAFNGTQLFSNASAGITLTSFMRQVELVSGNAPLAAAGGLWKPSALTGVVSDQANVPSAAAVTAIPGASVTTGVSYLTAAAPLLARSFAMTNAATLVSTGGVTAVNALSATLTADAFGPTATFNPPFTRVDFYAVVAGNLELIGSTTAFSTVDDGSAFGRRHRFSITWTPGTTSPISGTTWPLGAASIFAVGVNANGDALVSLVNANMTITQP